MKRIDGMLGGEEAEGVGVKKDEEQQSEEIEASYTLGGAGR
jgi:hypothetical protein